MCNPTNTKGRPMNLLRLRGTARRVALVLTGIPLALASGALWAADLHYYDGGQPRAIQLQPGLVAEFTRASDRRTVLAAHPAAVALQGAGDPSVRIYRVPATSTAQAAVPAGSPVYREGRSPAGRLMALPGGVLLKFKPDWTRARIDAWLAQRGYTVESRLGIDGNWFKVATAAGQASLQAANDLFESGELLSASPNWWKQTRTR
jgi:hypothetical protein